MLPHQFSTLNFAGPSYFFSVQRSDSFHFEGVIFYFVWPFPPSRVVPPTRNCGHVVVVSCYGFMYFAPYLSRKVKRMCLSEPTFFFFFFIPWTCLCESENVSTHASRFLLCILRQLAFAVSASTGGGNCFLQTISCWSRLENSVGLCQKCAMRY